MEGPLGFDLEWESEGGTPRRVALVQLSTVHVVVLIQVSAMRGTLEYVILSPIATNISYQGFHRSFRSV